MSKKKKQTGGYLKGPSHKEGGILAVVDGDEPVELEGEEYIMSADAVRRFGKKNMDRMNFEGKMPLAHEGGSAEDIPQRFRKEIRYMEHGGEVSISDDNATAGDIHTTHSHSNYKVGK
jgi:hypothetical protein